MRGGGWRLDEVGEVKNLYCYKKQTDMATPETCMGYCKSNLQQ